MSSVTWKQEQMILGEKPRHLVRTRNLEDTKAYKSQQIGFIKDTAHSRSMGNIFF